MYEGIREIFESKINYISQKTIVYHLVKTKIVSKFRDWMECTDNCDVAHYILLGWFSCLEFLVQNIILNLLTIINCFQTLRYTMWSERFSAI